MHASHFNVLPYILPLLTHESEVSKEKLHNSINRVGEHSEKLNPVKGLEEEGPKDSMYLPNRTKSSEKRIMLGRTRGKHEERGS